MKRSFQFLILLFLNLTLLLANSPKNEHRKLPLSISLPHLKSIQKDAIVLGVGPTHAYVFIDPLCPRSQDFIEAISENKNIQTEYTYFIFLYELKRFHSSSLIQTIYADKKPLNKMLDIMIHKNIVDQKNIINLYQSKIDAIVKVAEIINVYKRPYLVLVKKRKQ